MDSKSEEEMPFPKIITKEIPMGTEMVRTEKKEEPVAAPVMPMPVRQTSAAKTTCLCSPTTHAGSFRCRLHRSQDALQRTKSVDSVTHPDSSVAPVTPGNSNSS
ncbi:hypothetical protein GIB67_004425 [Kingdonia uniflora]|uniref:Uncharacterized protein n=1 Tax=Kingdonia uniflora TaxID=39325 RepID=A0A7J7MRN6_9MAGN|nr:hypothetical protein GIB67_004425 [Kingdonia uniflora]